METRTSAVFSAALDGCHRLQSQFPSDDCLRSMVEQIEHWTAALVASSPKSGMRRTKRRRLEPRNLRPIDEDVARIVQYALTEAQRLGLA